MVLRDSGHVPEAPLFYTWSARDSRGNGAGGVTTEPDRATDLLRAAIDRLAPGASGLIRFVRLDPESWPSAYLLGPVLLRARRDPATDVMVLECSDAQ